MPDLTLYVPDIFDWCADTQIEIRASDGAVAVECIKLHDDGEAASDIACEVHLRQKSLAPHHHSKQQDNLLHRP